MYIITKSSKKTNVFREYRYLIFILLIKITKTIVTKKFLEYSEIYIENIFLKNIIGYIFKTKNIFVFNFKKRRKINLFFIKITDFIECIY